MGEGLVVAGWTPSLARALELAGAIDEALATVEQALQTNAHDISWPEILRFRGELRLKLTQTEPAEADFRKAIALAQKTGAKAWELRATTSLARLLVEQGHGDEGRIMLAEIHNWFHGGFDTADLKEAKALLDELSQ